MKPAATKGRSATGANPGPDCPVCSAAGGSAFASARDRLFGAADGEFQLFRCPFCGCIFQHPFPEPAALASFYPAGYWWSERSRSALSTLLSRLEKAYREFVARDHVRFLARCATGSPGRALLDIGCGSGTFLHLARRRGFLPHGMDASARAAEEAKTQYGLDVRCGEIGSVSWDGSKFDFVTMFHVLEHLPDPARALAFARALLKPGGSLILQVPNAGSWQAGIFGVRWYGFDVPRHLINFTPRSLALLLDREGFSYRLESRFSLRDNPAALASSLAVGLDPIGRRGRGRRAHAAVEGALEFGYFALFLAAIAPSWIESACGRGATLWVHARRGSG